ncbi:MAG: hypothetical protein ACR2K3_10960 [Nocardioides sp.]
MRPPSCPRCPLELSGSGPEWARAEHGRVGPPLVELAFGGPRPGW